MQAGLETFNQQPCSPESCHSVTLAKVLLFGKAAPFFAKKVTAATSFSGPYTHWIFGLQEVVLPSCVESLLLEQNPTLLYLRNDVKSFVFRAGRKVPHCQKRDCLALPLFALDRAISRLFSISILKVGETKTGAPNHALERVAILFLGLRHDPLNAPSCFKSLPETMKPQKAGRMTQTSTC